mmetsp:Transcript_43652/g.102641  ORF Transcript_43652/g.102641 Transcript_43652/m.102641 type:complete len:243 (+) Transcript_43652:198-926(+)
MARVGTAQSRFSEVLQRPFTVNTHTPKYKGKRLPALKYDSGVGKDMPAWSSSLLHCCDNPDMVLCALTGVGIFAIHGHTQDALYNGGCFFTCWTGAITWGECGRQRRYLRKRLQMSGGEYCFKGCVGDCTETICCLPFTVCQEAREIEIRSRRKWHWLRGFRGVGEPLSVALCGDETLEYVLVGYEHQERDILSAQFFATQPDDIGSEFGGKSESEESRSEAQSEGAASMLEAPVSIDSMTR